MLGNSYFGDDLRSRKGLHRSLDPEAGWVVIGATQGHLAKTSRSWDVREGPWKGLWQVWLLLYAWQSPGFKGLASWRSLENLKRFLKRTGIQKWCLGWHSVLCDMLKDEAIYSGIKHEGMVWCTRGPAQQLDLLLAVWHWDMPQTPPPPASASWVLKSNRMINPVPISRVSVGLMENNTLEHS